MANILFTWEMGDNLGHLAGLRPFMQMASRQGHTLGVALRNLRYARLVLAGLEFRCFQAPFRHSAKPRPTPQCLSYAHTLEDFCFSGSDELVCYLQAWQEIFAAFQPDVVFYDCSPGALIASHGSRFGKIITGSGYFVPPTGSRAGVFAPFMTTPGDKATVQSLRRNDRRLLKVLNGGCKRVGLPPFESLAGIYSQADLALHATLPELDQFGARADANYLGVEPSFATARPAWPRGGQDKVFCYLQNFPGIKTLLEELCASQLQVLVYCRDLPAAVLAQLQKLDNIAFTGEPVNLDEVGRQARFVVHHAGHATSVQLFLAGVPQLSIPRYQEQLLTALQLDRAGVGVTALHHQRSFAGEIRRIHQQSSYRERALHFQQLYADFSWEQSENRVREELDQLLARAGG